MSEDKREEILARLEAVGATLVPAANVFRNQIDIPESARPAFVILDGDETTDESSFGRGRPANAPLIMAMTPEVFVLLEAGADKVGPAVNTYRARVLKAILHDASLIALSDGGAIRYQGTTTGLAVGRSMEAELFLDFAFRYVLRPDRL